MHLKTRDVRHLEYVFKALVDFLRERVPSVCVLYSCFGSTNSGETRLRLMAPEGMMNVVIGVFFACNKESNLSIVIEDEERPEKWWGDWRIFTLSISNMEKGTELCAFISAVRAEFSKTLPGIKKPALCTEPPKKP